MHAGNIYGRSVIPCSSPHSFFFEALSSSRMFNFHVLVNSPVLLLFLISNLILWWLYDCCLLTYMKTCFMAHSNDRSWRMFYMHEKNEYFTVVVFCAYVCLLDCTGLYCQSSPLLSYHILPVCFIHCWTWDITMFYIILLFSLLLCSCQWLLYIIRMIRC